MGDMQWRLAGEVDTLRQKPCWRFRCVSTSPKDLVLVYVAKTDRFYALDGKCSHIGKSLSRKAPRRSKEVVALTSPRNSWARKRPPVPHCHDFILSSDVPFLYLVRSFVLLESCNVTGET